MSEQPKTKNRYAVLIEKIFFDHWKEGLTEFGFDRGEIESCADDLAVKLPKNLGDLLYSFRFRNLLPDKIVNTAPPDMEWRILLAGRANYRFKLGKKNRIVPRPEMVTIKIPNSTPELITSYAQDDEQALLAIVRYNRLIDIFLGITTYSLQNHLRTTVKGVGQIEIDELYVGVDKHGCHYVIPVQAKGGKDQISVVQTEQDLAACAEKFPGIRCRSISVQFMSEAVVALFELAMEDSEIKIVDERHYKFVPATELDDGVIKAYRG